MSTKRNAPSDNDHLRTIGRAGNTGNMDDVTGPQSGDLSDEELEARVRDGGSDDRNDASWPGC